MALSGQLQMDDKLLLEPYLMTESNDENFFPHFALFLTCFAATQKLAAARPQTLWSVATPLLGIF